MKDNKAGHQWRYYNNKRSKPTFAATRAAGLYITNCMGGIAFLCKDAGVPGAALDFYGGKNKIVYASDDAKRRTHKVFDVLRVNRTVKSAVKKGIIQPGDILTYVTMTHTNMYIGGNKSFDSGHAYCDESGEGAPFKKWIGTLAHQGKKCKYALRLKSSNVYRVQVGAFEHLDKANKRITEVQTASGFGCFMEQTDMIRVYCGSFERPQNAIDRVNDLELSGIMDSFITVK